MIFQHTFQAVIEGRKTQTRRIVKPGHGCGKIAAGTPLEFMPVGYGWGDIVAVRSKSGRDIYAVGKTYAVQPGRGQKAVARIRITSIRREDVRYISEADAIAEGFFDTFAFLWTWTQMHDKPAWNANQKTDFSDGDESGITHHPDAWMSWLKGTRPAKCYDAWVLTFEVVR